jgi:hypothetical protein
VGDSGFKNAAPVGTSFVSWRAMNRFAHDNECWASKILKKPPTTPLPTIRVSERRDKRRACRAELVCIQQTPDATGQAEIAELPMVSPIMLPPFSRLLARLLVLRGRGYNLGGFENR